MKTIRMISLLVVVLAVSSYGTTIGFVGAGTGTGSDIASDYCSNVSANGAGWTVDDGTGTTEDIRLEWAPANTWEYDNRTYWNSLENVTQSPTQNDPSDWDDNGYGTSVCMLDDNDGLKFYSDDAGQAIVFNSVDVGLIWGASASATWTVSITTQSDTGTVLWTDTTSVLSGAQGERVDIGFTGVAGEDYLLHFDVGGGGVATEGGFDNLSFSQIPEPASLGLVAFTGGALLWIRRKRA